LETCEVAGVNRPFGDVCVLGCRDVELWDRGLSRGDVELFWRPGIRLEFPGFQMNRHPSTQPGPSIAFFLSLCFTEDVAGFVLNNCSLMG
jgi:hypothetical protein